MSWIFGSIDFDTYGVMVSKSSGVLDLPKLKHEGYDWLDENGKDYWQSDTQYDDREIVLNCWILAENDVTYTGYENFITKVAAFTDAIKAAGKVTLQTPYINIDGCSISKGITVLRETNYVNDIQAGTFTLRITVHGDSDYNLINICRNTSTNVIEVVKTNNLTIRKSLQDDMYASMSFESNEKLDIQYFDFIQYEYDGNGFDRFTLETEPKFTKKSSNKYAYDLTFRHQTNWLAHTQFLASTGESDFYFYGDLEDVLDLILSNHARSGYNKFQKGTIATTISKNHQFNNEDCLSVLKRICAEYELEYEFDHQVPGWYYIINVAEQVANTTGVTLQYGLGNGQYELSRSERQDNEFFTVLYAYGSTKNLKPDYRSGLQRLSFTNNPLSQNTATYGYKEKTVILDDIYPQRTATVTGYSQTLPASLTDAEKLVWPGGIYRIEDTTIDFDLNDYLLGGLTAKIRIKTGNLAGFEFEIARYENASTYIYIIPFKDERGGMFPNATLQIAIGDEYTLVDMDQPATYITTAETELENTAIDLLAEGSTPKYKYTGKIDPKFIEDNPIAFEVGDRVTLVDTDYGINGLFRISELTYNDFTKVWDLTFADKAELHRLQKIEAKIDQQERASSDTDATAVETTRKNQMTTNELSNILLNPADIKLNEPIVRDEFIDPRMLAYDAGVPQFSLKNALVETNVDGDFDKVTVDAGKLVITNWEDSTLSRYEISQDRAGYDPTRTWDIPATTLNLATANGYWVYAKINLASGSTACTIEAYEEHKEVKLSVESGYLMYKLGFITDRSSPRYASMLWGNVRFPKMQDPYEDDLTNGENDIDVGFTLKPGSNIFRNGSLLPSRAWTGVGTTTLHLVAPGRAGEWIKVEQ